MDFILGALALTAFTGLVSFIWFGLFIVIDEYVFDNGLSTLEPVDTSLVLFRVSTKSMNPRRCLFWIIVSKMISYSMFSRGTRAVCDICLWKRC